MAGTCDVHYELMMRRLISCNAICKKLRARLSIEPRAPYDPKINPLIVGPLRWAYQLLRQTIGERFMDNSEVRMFIDRSFINVIALRAQTIALASCYH